MPPHNSECDIAISGASFAGLALAAALSQAFNGDVRLAVIDPALDVGKLPDDGRAFAIWAGSRKALQALGAWSEIAPHAQQISAIEISDSALDDGVRPTLIHYDGLTSGGDAVAHMVPTHVLHRALYACVASDPSITWCTPASVKSVAFNTPGATVALSDGRELSARLVVAADGRASLVRDAAGIDTVGWDYDQIGIVTTVACELPHNGVAVQHFLPGGPFAILPLKDNRACITWSATRDEAERILARDEAGFVAELDRRIAGCFGNIQHVGPKRSWPLTLKLPRSLFAQRAVLIGDAAHGVHPVAGQGANLALRDVAALTDVIMDAAHIGLDIGDGNVLERYQRWRRFDSTMSAGLYDGLNRLFSIDNTLLRAGRGAALGVLDQLPQMKRWIMDEASGLNGELPRLMRGRESEPTA